MTTITTVTYIGEDGALVHGRPGGEQYTFFRGQPLKITDKEDIEFYRGKEARGSPFRVTSKKRVRATRTKSSHHIPTTTLQKEDK